MRNSKTLRNQVIYSIFTRNYTPEGTFNAITDEEIARIKALGTDIIWFMPIHPIGEKNRKGSLGSPYAIKDYRAVNPELGTLEDFKAVVARIHAQGMKVLIDVVYNHTSPDSVLSIEHPEWFFKKANGDFGNKTGDWWDVIDLDYTSGNDLWNYQIETLQQWAKIVDGFRCDVASLVPLEFWKMARKQVAEVNPETIWLAESVEFNFIESNRQQGFVGLSDSEIFQAFDMAYEYDTFYAFREYLDGERTLKSYIDLLSMQRSWYGADKVKLRYMENHDTFRTINKVEGSEYLAWTAFTFFSQGAVLLYNGQEVEDANLPSLFDKDVVNWETGKDNSAFLAKLADIKTDPIFANGYYDITLSEDEHVIMTTYIDWTTGRTVYGLFPVAGSGVADIDLEAGDYVCHLTGDTVSVEGGHIQVDQPLVLEVLK
jgi:glycosidase